MTTDGTIHHLRADAFDRLVPSALADVELRGALAKATDTIRNRRASALEVDPGPGGDRPCDRGRCLGFLPPHQGGSSTRGPSGVMDPGRGVDQVPRERLCEVVDLVAGHEPHPVHPRQFLPGVTEDLTGAFCDPIDPLEVGDVVDVGNRLAESVGLDPPAEDDRAGVLDLPRQSFALAGLFDEHHVDPLFPASSRRCSASIDRRYFQLKIPVWCPSENRIRIA